MSEINHDDLIGRAAQEAHRLRAASPDGSGGSALAGGTLQARLAAALPEYRVDHELSRGGQGVVFLALQNATGRQVAIKVLRSGLLIDDAERIRFRREVQLLAQLRHPNIVNVLDSGVFEETPYLIMEYVPGEALDAWFRNRPFELRPALDLFAAICEAVSAAHLRGVIHRDLKPGNVRVDPSGVPHLLDFGLARLMTDDPLAVESDPTLTQPGQFVGSLPWASPEQAEGSGPPLDLRTDVYSLGVLLYHGLTGRFPYRVSGAMREVVEQIVHATPQRPSTLRTGIDGELETIILKALAKDRERRYQSAGDLARDLRRYLAGEPIEARRDSLPYMLRKQLQRHRITLTFAALLLAVTLVGLVVSLRFWMKSERERQAADLAAQRAEREARKAVAINDFLTRDILAQASPELQPGTALTVRQALDNAAQRIGGRFEGQAEVEAAIRETLGDAYRALGEYEPADEHFRQSVALLRSVPGVNPVDLSRALGRLGGLERTRSRYAEAEALLTESLEVSLQAAESDRALQWNLAASDLASLYASQARYAEAEPLLRQVVDYLSAKYGRSEQRTLVTLNNLAGVLAELGRYEESAGLMREVVAALQAEMGADHPRTLRSRQNLALILSRTAALSESEQMFAEIAAAQARLLGPDHPATLNTSLGHAEALALQKRFDEAERIFRSVLGRFQAQLGSAHINTVGAGLSLGQLLLQAERFAEALPVLRDAAAGAAEVLDGQHPRRVGAVTALGDCLRLLGQFEEAECVLLECLAAGRGAEIAASVRMPCEALITLYDAWGRPQDAAEYRGLFAMLDLLDGQNEAER